MVVQWTQINSIDTLLYPYALPLLINPLHFLKSLPKCNLSSSLRSLQSLCNHQILQFLYLHLRPLCLTPSDLTSLSLVLQHSCMHQNSQAPTILNSVFVLQPFRLIPQNLQKLLIFPMSLPSIMNLPTFSAKLKLKFSLLIVLIISKSIWKRVLNLRLALYTLFRHLNKRLSSILRKTLTQISFNQPHLCMVHQSYSLRRKTVHYVFVLNSTLSQ